MSWFGPEDETLLRELFAIYDARVDFAEVIRAAALEEPAFAQVAASMQATWAEGETARTKRDILRRAMCEGDWGSYEAELRKEAIAYATHGVRDWQLLTRVIARQLTPHIVSELSNDPPRLARMLVAFHEFLGRITFTLGVAYVEHREAMIHEVEQRARRMIESASVGVWVCDEHGKTTFMNAHLANMLGITVEEGVSTPIGKFMEKKERDALALQMEDRRKGKSESYEQRYVRKDKSTGWALLETGPLFSNGKFEGVITMVTDITARRAAEEALQASEARFRRLADSGIIGILTINSKGRVIDVNDAITRIVGYSREELLDGSFDWASVTPPEYKALDAIAAEQLETNAISSSREKEYIRKDGTRVPVLVGVAHIHQSDEFIAFVLDLTERKLAEAQVEHLRLQRAADAKFRALLEAAPDAMVIVTEDGIIDTINVQAETLFGYSREELLGQRIEVLVPERSRAVHPSRFASYFKNPTRRAIGTGLEVFARRKDGREIPIDVSLGPLHTDGKLLVSAAIRDITERRRIETALRLANHELEAFSYSVAHDLRAPLRGMNGFAKILLEDYASKLDEQGVRHLDQICKNANRMAELIDALLALAQVTRREIHVVPTDLSNLATITVAELRASSKERDVEVTIASNLICEADPALLATLLDNLLGNAWKFTQKRADARIEVGRAGGTFFVRDNGAGFDMAHSKNLFAPFHRLHGAGEYPGTGIGLATSRRIVERHGGRIWAESAPNNGATFYFSFPRTRSDAHDV